MDTTTLCSVLVLFTIISIISINPAFAEHAEVTVTPVAGSGSPGCEETSEGCFTPSTAIVDVDGKVIFSNTDSAAHTFTSGMATDADSVGVVFDSSLVMTGNSYEWTPTEVGDQPYFCIVHPWMTGMITVQGIEETHEKKSMVGILEESSKDELTVELPKGNVEGIDIGSTALWVETSGGKVYVSNPKDGTIHVIDTDTRKVIDTIQSMEGVTILEVVEDKNKIYASILEYAPIQVYDLRTGEHLGEIDIGQPVVTLWSKSDKPYGQREYIDIETNAIGLKYNPNTELLYAAHTTVNHVNIIDTKTDKSVGEIPTGKSPLFIKIDEERNIGYVTNYESNNVSVIDLETNKEIKTLNTGFVPNQMEIDYDNKRLYVTHLASSHVTVIDIRTQEIETKIQLDGPTHAVSLDTDYHILHVSHIPESGFTGSGASGKVEFIDTATNQFVGNLVIPDNPYIIDIDTQNHNLYASIIKEGVILIVHLDDDPVYQGILAQAEEITAESLNEEQGEGGGCLIATATYGSELATQVQFLREIRDNTVMSTSSGVSFMSGFNQLYYSFSPPIADLERENPMFQEAVRAFITPMISTLSIMTLADDGSEVEVLGLGISVIALNLGMYIAAPAIVGYKIHKRLKSKNN